MGLPVGRSGVQVLEEEDEDEACVSVGLPPAQQMDELAALDRRDPWYCFLEWLAVVISQGGGEIALLLPAKKWR